jgi:hypothetical protein
MPSGQENIRAYKGETRLTPSGVWARLFRISLLTNPSSSETKCTDFNLYLIINMKLLLSSLVFLGYTATEAKDLFDFNPTSLFGTPD